MDKAIKSVKQEWYRDPRTHEMEYSYLVTYADGSTYVSHGWHPSYEPFL